MVVKGATTMVRKHQQITYRDYLLIAAQASVGNQAIGEVNGDRLAPRVILALEDRRAKQLALGVRAWLQEHHPMLFKGA